MAERFGIARNPDGTFRQFDGSKVFAAAGDTVAEQFDFRLHIGAFGLFSKDNHTALQNTLVQTGLSREEVTKQLELIHELNAVAISSQAPLFFGGQQFDYALFLNAATPAINAPGFIAEEIVHAEHIQMLKDKGLTLKEIQRIFHPLTTEFLGYLGRRHVDEVVGLPGGYNGRLRPAGGSKSHFAHFFGYQLADELHDRKIPLSFPGLFHAPDETAFWEPLRTSLGGETIPMVVPVPIHPQINLDTVVKNAEETIREAKVDTIIKPSFISLPLDGSL